eukprot:jgi/Mesvir1/12497/Mv08109-RA.1
MVSTIARAWWGSLFFAVFLACLRGRDFECLAIPRQELLELREEVRSMFNHAVNGYMEYAFPYDELMPLSCKGKDTLGGYSLTLVDSLDTIALMGNASLFARSVEWVSNNLNFDRNISVSVFETNIRVLGGLLSAHLLAIDESSGVYMPNYTGGLLTLAHDLGLRLLPAFDTPTGIPYGTVNLRYGVPKGENTVTSTAGGGTLTLEFGLLSRLTGDCRFEAAAKNAALSLWSRRSGLHLMGGHIDVFSGEWTHKDAGIGTSIDSFFEYLLKAYLLLSDPEYFEIFNAAYAAVMQHLHRAPWYVEVNMDTGVLVWPIFNSMQAFWPGLQVLAGNIRDAERTHEAFASVWRLFGSIPEGFNLASMQVQHGQRNYPLRPELVESTYLLYQATRASRYLEFGRDVVTSLQRNARTSCGFAHLRDVVTRQQEDAMESFFLAETLKYLFLLFDASLGGDNYVDRGVQPYIFSTEGHPFPINLQTATPPPGHGACCATPYGSCFNVTWHDQLRRGGGYSDARSGHVSRQAAGHTAGFKGKGQGANHGGAQGRQQGDEEELDWRRSCPAPRDLDPPQGHTARHPATVSDPVPTRHPPPTGVLASTTATSAPSCAFTPIRWDQALLEELLGGPRVRPPMPQRGPLEASIMSAQELATERALNAFFMNRQAQAAAQGSGGFFLVNKDGGLAITNSLEGGGGAGGESGGGGNAAAAAFGMFFLFHRIAELQEKLQASDGNNDNSNNAGVPKITIGDVGMVRSVGTDAAPGGTLEVGMWGQQVFILQEHLPPPPPPTQEAVPRLKIIVDGAVSPESISGETGGEDTVQAVLCDSSKHEGMRIQWHGTGHSRTAPQCGLLTRQAPPAATVCRWWSWGQGPLTTASVAGGRVMQGEVVSGGQGLWLHVWGRGQLRAAVSDGSAQLAWEDDGRVKLCWVSARASR